MTGNGLPHEIERKIEVWGELRDFRAAVSSPYFLKRHTRSWSLEIRRIQNDQSSPATQYLIQISFGTSGAKRRQTATAGITYRG